MKLRRKIHKISVAALTAGIAVFALVCLFFFFYFDPLVYDQTDNVLAKVGGQLSKTASSSELSVPAVVVTHKKTPEVVKAVYMSSWVAATPNVRERLLKRIEGTEINAIVMDIKDYSGKIIVDIDTPTLGKYHSMEGRVPDIRQFIDYLHKKNYYVIGRISVFQDDFLSRRRPDLAIKRLDNREIWTDKKGIAWLDVSSTEVWDYAVTVAKESYAAGFDELNFDYIRFPSDGNVSNIFYPYYRSNLETKAEALRKFFVYLNAKMKDLGAASSANVFGMVTTNTDDLGIGQVLENAVPYFDYISPMVYPSHYPTGFLNYKKPATVPYEIVKYSMETAASRIVAQGYSPLKLRPWLQDFDLGADYTADMIRAQKRAVYDAGLTSWMMWDPSNVYTIEAYK